MNMYMHMHMHMHMHACAKRHPWQPQKEVSGKKVQEVLSTDYYKGHSKLGKGWKATTGSCQAIHHCSKSALLQEMLPWQQAFRNTQE